MNQYVLAGIAAAALAAGAFTAGWRVNSWRHDAQALHDTELAEKAGRAATDAAVAAIQSIDIKRVTIRQELEREIRYAPAAPPECDVTVGVFNALNKGLAGPLAAQGTVPGPDAAARPQP